MNRTTIILMASILQLTSATFGQQAASLKPTRAQTDDFVIAGQCVSREDFNTPVPGVEIRLYAVRGLLEQSTEIAKTVSDAQGAFRFADLESPRESRLHSLRYYLAAKTLEGPVIIAGVWNPDDAQSTLLIIIEESGSLKGQVVDERGEPIVGASLEPYTGTQGIDANPSATTNAQGLFILRGVPIYVDRQGKPRGVSVRISHPDYPTATLKADEVPSAVTFTLKTGCRVTGVVQDLATREPLQNVIVSAITAESRSGAEAHAVTDGNGAYRLNLVQGTYNLILEDESFVAEAVVDVECRDGDIVELAPMLASAGGWVTGHVINTDSGEPMAFNPQGKRIALGLYGPGRPPGRLLHQHFLAEVDDQGRFRIRAAAGENFPFFCNLRGARMAWDTTKQPPIFVVAGKETACVMEFTPQRTAQQKMEVAERVLDSLPTETDKRVDAIIEEFRKLNHTVDECETWCLLMRELVTIGKPAVLPLCAEFEATDKQFMMRRLAFALRAIGDPRAVPTLIRVLPKTLQPPMSDYGLIVTDNDLTAFMQKHGDDRKGQHFSFQRPVRETHHALNKLTKRNGDVRELSGMHKAADLRSLARQEQSYYAAASEWAAWWEANWEQFGVDRSFSKVNLPAYVPRDLSDYPTGLELTKNAKVEGGKSQMVVTPVGDADKGASFFLDLDTGGGPRWPAELPALDSSAEVVAAAKEWAADKGVDLICVPSQNAEGDAVYTLVGIGLQLWEIDPFDAKNIEKRIAKGELPEGREVKDALLHYDAKSKQYVPARGSSFLYVTREQGLGVITITDFVTEARDVTGAYGPIPGVGFHRGVRFDYQSIAR